MALNANKGVGVKILSIVFHSMTGGTRAMVGAAERGARGVGGVDVRVVEAGVAGVEDVVGADGVLFAGPENLAALSGVMKAFFDRTYYGVLGKVEGRPYAQMVCAGSDGTGAVRQLARIVTGWRMKEVAVAVIVCTHAQTAQEILAPKVIGEGDLRRCQELGAVMAAGLGLGVF